MKRIFIAINLPDEIKQEIKTASQKIRNSFPMEVVNKVGKWVSKDNLHITLCFIGEVKDELLPKIIESAQRAVKNAQQDKDTAGLAVKLDKICYGAVNRGIPRLIWLELQENSLLKKLAFQLKKELSEQGILRNFDNRPFSGHITLCRIKAWVFKKIEPEERPEIEREINLNFQIKTVDIMESQLKRTGSQYVIVNSIPLN